MGGQAAENAGAMAAGGAAAAYRGDFIGLSTVFKQQSDNVGVTLLRRLVEGSVTHLHTDIDLLIIDLFVGVSNTKTSGHLPSSYQTLINTPYTFFPFNHPSTSVLGYTL